MGEYKTEAKSSITWGTPGKSGSFKYYLNSRSVEEYEKEIELAVKLYKVFQANCSKYGVGQ